MTTDARGKSHKSAGTPDGGQFAKLSKSEGIVTLPVDDVWKWNGQYSSAQEALDTFIRVIYFDPDTKEKLFDGTDEDSTAEEKIAAIARNAPALGYHGLQLPVRASAPARVAEAQDRFADAEAEFRDAEYELGRTAVAALGETFKAKYDGIKGVVLTYHNGYPHSPLIDHLIPTSGDVEAPETDSEDEDVLHRYATRLGNPLRAIDAGFIARTGTPNQFRINI